MKRFSLPAFGFILFAACQATGDPAPTILPAATKPVPGRPCEPKQAARPNVKKVLFVGNSLTYTNDLPYLVAALGAKNGVLIEMEMIAFPNYALPDHWSDGCIQVHIKSGFYDFVVVQQGPSSQDEGRRMLMEYGALIQQLCTAHETKLAFFMVWPAVANFNTFEGVIKNYTDAASSTGSILCPVGQIWRNHIQHTGDYSYYGLDQFHPSLEGSEVAAEIIYKALFP